MKGFFLFSVFLFSNLGLAVDSAPCFKESYGCKGEFRFSPNEQLPLYTNFPLDQGSEFVTRAVITIHGVLRDSEDYFKRTWAGAKLSGAERDTLIIAPQFKAEEDSHSTEEMLWEPKAWPWGQPSTVSKTSSYEVLDRLIELIQERNLFPEVKTIVLVGHSAGGQFISRYVALNQLKRTDDIRFVVSNPSTYLYLNENRPTPDSFGVPDAKDCKGYDSYGYGLQGRDGYLKHLSDEAARERFVRSEVVLLLGDKDTETELLDQSCEAMLQGKNRWERGQAFFAFIRKYFPASVALLAVVPGVGHSSEEMYRAPEGRRVLFQ